MRVLAHGFCSERCGLPHPQWTLMGVSRTGSDGACHRHLPGAVLGWRPHRLWYAEGETKAQRPCLQARAGVLR